MSHPPRFQGFGASGRSFGAEFRGGVSGRSFEAGVRAEFWGGVLGREFGAGFRGGAGPDAGQRTRLGGRAGPMAARVRPGVGGLGSGPGGRGGGPANRRPAMEWLVPGANHSMALNEREDIDADHKRVAAVAGGDVDQALDPDGGGVARHVPEPLLVGSVGAYPARAGDVVVEDDHDAVRGEPLHHTIEELHAMDGMQPWAFRRVDGGNGAG